MTEHGKRDWRTDGLVRRTTEKATGSKQESEGADFLEDGIKPKRIFTPVLGSEAVEVKNPNVVSEGTVKDHIRQIKKLGYGAPDDPEMTEIVKSVKEGTHYQHYDGALEIIEIARRSKEIPRSALADHLGLTETGYYNIERGKTKVSWVDIKKIMLFLEIKITINGQEI